MKIRAIGMNTEPGRGGADRYFAGLLGGLSERAADVTAGAFGPENPELPMLQSLGPQGMPIPRRIGAIRRFITASHADIVASHFALYGLPAVGNLDGGAHVVHFHGPWAIEAAREKEKPWAVAAKHLVERAVYHSAARLIVLSEAFRDVLVERYGVAAERVTVIPGGIDLERFRPMDREAARERMGWPRESRLILTVRRLVPRMGLEHLINAMRSVPDATLVVGGSGPLASALEERCANLGLRKRVIFAGYIPEENLATAYAAADFSVVPSESLEGFGLVALESLACGRPVLVTPVGGLPEVVAGLDPSLVMGGSFADALNRALLHPHLLPGEDACRAHAEKFGWNEIARRVLDVYREAAHA